ncbi:MAG: M20/M25/M40 family metallo-hydrolase, partial [Chloroflexi bacterium]|nr:M20/M25/M40 family metallo-hydrolase [Chloroflexota bacterium]
IANLLICWLAEYTRRGRPNQIDHHSESQTQVHSLVSESRIKHAIRELAASPRNSRENPEDHKRAADWIASEFEQAGLAVSRQTFEIPDEIPGQVPPRQGVNVIGTLNRPPGGPRDPVDSTSILIGAHYDTVPHSPGADDNASGVAAMLECARALRESNIDREVTFVAFDAEEIQSAVEGLYGSTAYVARLAPGESPSAAIIFESVGFSSATIKQRLPGSFRFLFRKAYRALIQQNFAADSLLILSKGPGRAIARRLEESASSPDIQLPILPLEVPRWMPLVRDLRRSDHAPFWLAGIPAVLISDTANFRNPHYHQTTDTPDTVDVVLVARAARMVIDAIERRAI